MQVDENQQPQEDTRSLAQEMATFTNAVALKGLLDDERWKQFIVPVIQHVRSQAAKRRDSVQNSMDGAFEDAFLRGVRKGMDVFETQLRKLYLLASREIEDARRNRPV